MPRSRYEQKYGYPARGLVLMAAKELKEFTYDDLAHHLYDKGYRVKLETIKRAIRQLRAEGLVKEAGEKPRRGGKPAKIFRYVGSVVM